MEKPLDYLNNLNENDWLIGYDSSQFNQLVQELYLELIQLSASETSPKIILAEREPLRFLASFLAACAANCPVFLCNPDWGTQEWQQVFDLVQPDIVLGMGRWGDGEMGRWGDGEMGRWGDGEMGSRGAGEQGRSDNNISPPHLRTSAPCPMPHTQCPLIMIPTGGSSGQIKFVIHTWETLIASVQGFTEYFQIKKVNSFCVLPLYHVSGLMQFLRSFTTGGKVAILPFKTLESGKILNIKQSEFFISLVPTQLQRLLQNSELTEWLSEFNTVLLGGAPAWKELLEKAKFDRIRLAPTYGMTETASQIATLKPDDFLNGKTSSGQVLPHAKVTIHNQQGEILNCNEIGNITIQAQSLALGYYPIIQENQDNFRVDDLGFLDEQGYLNIVGRSSEKIITGGENIYPAEIESAIRETQLVTDICVIGIPDKHWGQALTAIYIPKKSNISALKIKTLLKDKLTKFKIPKYWIPQENLPRNSQGKTNRQQLEKIAIAYLQNTLK